MKKFVHLLRGQRTIQEKTAIPFYQYHNQALLDTVYNII